MKFAILAAAVLATATPAMAEDWHSFSGTASRAYLADVDSIAAVGNTTAIRMASVPTAGRAGDLTRTETLYEFQCAARRWRTVGTVEYEADGTSEAYPEEGAEWEPLRANTVPDFVKQIACDGSRSTTATFPSIRAFIEAGRQ